MRQSNARQEIQPHRRRAVVLASIFLAGLLLRLGWALYQPADPANLDRLPDQREYFQLAGNLLSSDHALFFVDPRFDQKIYAYRTPGYPLFLAACGANLTLIRIIQALIDSSVILAVYWLAGRWLSRAGALCAAGAVAFNPLLIYFSGLILSESLFTAMLAWGAALLAHGRGRRGVWVDLAGILVLAMSVLVRPSAIALPVLMMGAALLTRRWKRSAPVEEWSAEADPTKNAQSSPRSAAYSLAMVLAAVVLTMAVLLPWAWRNDQRLHHWIWTTTNSGITAYDGLNPGATGASDQSFIGSLPELRRADWNEVDRDHYLAHQAAQWAKDHPKRTLELSATKIARTWSPIPLSLEYGRLIYQLIAGVYAIPFDLLILFALFHRSRLLPGGAKFFLLTPAIYFTIVHAASIGSLRYRVPVEPLLAVLAAAAFTNFFYKRRNMDQADVEWASSP